MLATDGTYLTLYKRAEDVPEARAVILADG
jgi:hypothetical protein